MPIPRILFVDDEQMILDALRSSLRKDRHRWEMVFACGAQAAFDELEKAPFDVVISDMRMPDFDGVVVLQHFRELNPTATRMILSGQADPHAVIMALPVAHQFLSKPCSALDLRSAIERAIEVARLVSDPRLQAIVARVEGIPDAPATYWTLTRALAEPHTSEANVTAIIEEDQPVAAALLEIANATFANLPLPLSAVRDAVAHAGVSLTRGLALGAQVFAIGVLAPASSVSMGGLRARAVCVARSAALVHPSAAEEAFTAGLVKDAGKLLLALALPEQYGEVSREVVRSGRPLPIVEQEMLGATHEEVGAHLLGKWGLPLEMVEAVAYCSRPGEAPVGASHELLAAVQTADALVGEAMSRNPGPDSRLHPPFLSEAATSETLPGWRLGVELIVDSAGLRRSAAA